MTNLSPIRQTPSASPELARLGDGREPPPPARLARLFTPELVRDAQAVFGRRMHREISESERACDAREPYGLRSFTEGCWSA